MISLAAKNEKGVPPPTGEVFKLVAWHVDSHAIHSEVMAVVDTGLTIQLHPGVGLDVVGIGCMVLSHSFDTEGRLSVLVFGRRVEEGSAFAVAHVVEKSLARVRFFLTGGETGGRMVTGGGKTIEGGDSIGNPKS